MNHDEYTQRVKYCSDRGMESFVVQNTYKEPLYVECKDKNGFIFNSELVK